MSPASLPFPQHFLKEAADSGLLILLQLHSSLLHWHCFSLHRSVSVSHGRRCHECLTDMINYLGSQSNLLLEKTSCCLQLKCLPVQHGMDFSYSEQSQSIRHLNTATPLVGQVHLLMRSVRHCTHAVYCQYLFKHAQRLGTKFFSGCLSWCSTFAQTR
jgi:hypothetical protein